MAALISQPWQELTIDTCRPCPDQPYPLDAIEPATPAEMGLEPAEEDE